MNQTQTVVVYRSPMEALFYQNIGPISAAGLTFAILMWGMLYLRDRAARKYNWSIFSSQYTRWTKASIWVSGLSAIAMLFWLA
jgi:hypothetical protein